MNAGATYRRVHLEDHFEGVSRLDCQLAAVEVGGRQFERISYEQFVQRTRGPRWTVWDWTDSDTTGGRVQIDRSERYVRVCVHHLLPDERSHAYFQRKGR